MCDYYELLGVSRDADTDEIRRAYRRKIADAHPDKPGGNAELARALDEARGVLLDPTARARYDAQRLGTEIVDEAIGALTNIGERALDRLTLTVRVRGRQFLVKLRDRAAAKPRR